MSDPNIRKLSIPKLIYSKYCSKCKFCVKAEWSPNEGVKYGMLIVYCCANGGKFCDGKQVICPHGVAYCIPLGTEETFNPDDWRPERLNKTETFIYTEEVEKDEELEQKEL